VAAVAPNLSVPPVDTWSVSRCEFSYDWIVDDPNAVVDDTWPALPTHVKRSAQRIKNPFNGEGWVVSGHGGSFKLYNKEAAVRKQIERGGIDRERCRLSDDELMALAAGRLRFEYLAQREPLRETVLRVTPPTVGHLLGHLESEGSRILSEKWDYLTRNWRPTADSQVVRRLRAHYSSCTAVALLDFFVHVRLRGGVEGYKRYMGSPDSTVRRKLKQLRDAGVGMGTDEEIPRLTVPVWPASSTEESTSNSC
jgi:hypothetical protein